MLPLLLDSVLFLSSMAAIFHDDSTLYRKITVLFWSFHIWNILLSLFDWLLLKGVQDNLIYSWSLTFIIDLAVSFWMRRLIKSNLLKRPHKPQKPTHTHTQSLTLMSLPVCRFLWGHSGSKHSEQFSLSVWREQKGGACGVSVVSWSSREVWWVVSGSV